MSKKLEALVERLVNADTDSWEVCDDIDAAARVIRALLDPVCGCQDRRDEHLAEGTCHIGECACQRFDYDHAATLRRAEEARYD